MNTLLSETRLRDSPSGFPRGFPFTPQKKERTLNNKHTHICNVASPQAHGESIQACEERLPSREQRTIDAQWDAVCSTNSAACTEIRTFSPTKRREYLLKCPVAIGKMGILYSLVDFKGEPFPKKVEKGAKPTGQLGL